MVKKAKSDRAQNIYQKLSLKQKREIARRACPELFRWSDKQPEYRKHLLDPVKARFGKDAHASLKRITKQFQTVSAHDDPSQLHTAHNPQRSETAIDLATQFAKDLQAIEGELKKFIGLITNTKN